MSRSRALWFFEYCKGRYYMTYSHLYLIELMIRIDIWIPHISFDPTAQDWKLTNDRLLITLTHITDTLITTDWGLMTRMLSLWSLSLTISVSGTRRNDTGAGSGSAVTWRHPLLQSGVSPEILHHQPVVYIYYLLHSLDHTNKTFWQLYQWNYMCTKTKWLFNLPVLMLIRCSISDRR